MIFMKCQPSRSEEGLVEQVWAVGCSDHKHIAGGMEAIKLCKQLRHNSGKIKVIELKNTVETSKNNSRYCRPLG